MTPIIIPKGNNPLLAGVDSGIEEKLEFVKAPIIVPRRNNPLLVDVDSGIEDKLEFVYSAIKQCYVSFFGTIRHVFSGCIPVFYHFSI
jgi:hypothetical protein